MANRAPKNVVAQPCCPARAPRATFLARQHGRASYSMVVRIDVSLRFASLDARGFVGPLFFLQFIPKAFLSMRTQGFLLKVKQNTL